MRGFRRALLLLALGAAFGGCGESEGSAPPPARYTILCEGDGFTRGLEGRDYATQLERLLNERAGRRLYRAVNIGKPGQSTAGVAAGLPRHLRQERANLVIVLAGADNDWNAVHSARIPDRDEHEANTLTHLDEFDRDFYEPPERSAQTLLGAMALQRQGRYEEAMEGFKEYIRLEPEEVPGYAGLAACLMRRDRLGEAIEVLGRAVRVKPAPELLEIYIELGWAHLRAGRSETALEAWKEGLVRFPWSRRLFQSLAAGCRGRGDVWKALDAVKDMQGITANGLFRYLQRLEDLYGRTDLDEHIRRSLREDVRHICAVAKSRGVPVLFVSYPERVIPEVAETAVQEGAGFVDLREHFRRGFQRRNDYLTGDNYQSSAEGYRLMAEVLAPEVERLVPPR